MLGTTLEKANALYQSGRYDDALPEYERFLQAQPDSVQALYLRTQCLHAIAQRGNLAKSALLAEILDGYNRTLAIDPRHPGALANRGAVMIGLGRFDESIADLSAAIALKPANHAAHGHMGIALQNQNRIDEALACFDRALAIKQDDTSARLGVAECSLMTGNYRRGLPAYEWRFDYAGQRHMASSWYGETDIAGKTIVLGIDGGFGDAIQFCRYVPMQSARRRRDPLRAGLADCADARTVGQSDESHRRAVRLALPIAKPAMGVQDRTSQHPQPLSLPARAS
jgi:tetratricopeptide (TPR) repeat protein